MQTSLTVTQTV